MRLVSVDLDGYKRLVGAKVNLDPPVIAIVGPNEAGKTSLLRALQRLNDVEPFERGELTRGLPLAPEAAVLTALFELDPDDKKVIADLDDARAARWLFVSKLANGSLAFKVRPILQRDRTPRRRAAASLRRLAATAWANEHVLEDSDDGAEPAESPDGERSIADRVNELVSRLDGDANVLADEDLADLDNLSQDLSEVDGPPTLARAKTDLAAAIAKERAVAPGLIARDILQTRRPHFLEFDEAARDLASDYDLAAIDMSQVPPALANLADLAQLDLRSLLSAVGMGDYGTAEGNLEEANTRLVAIFREAWDQSDFTVRLSLDETVLRILVNNPGGGYSAIAERSDGLRAFVALIAFNARYRGEVPPVLLVDEAETHLHYDAQADVVRVFTRQQSAAKVIYTTHSAGCLPEDLGSGLRILVPEIGRHRSVFRNSFWSESEGGFDPLLLGMGASALAFASARYAVIAEGGADVILLPRLLREASRRAHLGYQVAPGLAEISEEAVARLDLAAARVAYVVDNDTAGRRIRKKLLRAGIPEERILILGSSSSGGLVLEDTIKAPLYQGAVNAELRRSHGESKAIPLNTIPASRRPIAVERWARSQKIAGPNRAAVALRLLEAAEPLISSVGKATLRTLDREITRTIGLDV